MKPEKKLVKDLNDQVGQHSLRVKVIEKSKSQVSPKNKSLNYQRIVFQDEEGGRIKSILYNDDIGAYETKIQHQVEYDICNAKIKPMPGRYRYGPDDHHFQLCFGAETVITAVEGSKPPLGPQYVTIAAIPRTITADDRYDILGVLIYVEPIRQLDRPDGSPLYVRETVVIDHSTEQPLIVTAWGDLATTEGAQLEELQTSFPVIGWTALKPSYHKGFSLSTTSSTFLHLAPTDDKAKTMKDWAEANKPKVVGKHQQMLDIRTPERGRVVTTIQKVRAKKAVTTLQEERHWLHVSSPEFDEKDVRVYLGCLHCGAGSGTSENQSFTCSNCKKKSNSAVPRMTATFEAIDSEGSFMFIAFTQDAEKLLGTKAAELLSMTTEEREKTLVEAESRIRATKMYIQVGPTTALSRNEVLKWVLKQISLK